MATDTSTTKGKYQVMQAADSGKPAQCRPLSGGDWLDCLSEPVWNWGLYEYRIRPEPRDFGVWVDQQTGTPRWQPWHEGLRGIAIRVREVLP